MIDVVTNLLGETVEVSRYESTIGPRLSAWMVAARGVVRAVYAASDQSLHMLIECSDESVRPGHVEFGGLASFSFSEGRVRVVAYCTKCCSWDFAKRIDATNGPAYAAHFVGFGCNTDAND